MNDHISELVDEMWPYINLYLQPRLNELRIHGGGSTSASTTSLSTADYPDALLRDGSRSLLGNLSVASGKTVDGVDLSALGDSFTAHLYGDVHTNYAPTDTSGITTRRAYEAGRLNKTVLAGSGLTGGGMLTGDITMHVGSGAGITANADDVAIDQTFSPTWTGTHQFNSTINSSTITPRATDTYDLGTSAKLWRSFWGSEINAALFVENSISVIGGWFYITKDQGTLAADVAAIDTTVDFGKAMVLNDYVLFRTAGVVEYMKVISLDTGTRYNVSRNLDGSGANAFVAGTVFAVLGQNGNGRIELNASDTPRIQVLKQGTNYSDSTEMVRLGDLNGNWGYVAETHGLALGEYSSNKPNITLDPTAGIRIRNHTTNVLEFKTDGTSAITGTLSVTGTLSAGGGDVTMGADGMRISLPTVTFADLNSYGFLDSGDAYVGGLDGFSDGTQHSIRVASDNTNATTVALDSKSAATATASLRSEYSTTSDYSTLLVDASSAGTSLYARAKVYEFDGLGKFRLGGTSFPASPANNDIYPRTDQDAWAQYDGTRWQTMHELPLAFHSYGGPTFSVTTSNIAVTMLRGDIAAYLRRMSCNVSVATTHNASDYWTVTVSNASGTFWTFDTYDAGAGRTTAANVNARVETTSFAMQPSTGMTQINVSITKVGAPGNLTIYVGGWYRHVLT